MGASLRGLEADLQRAADATKHAIQQLRRGFRVAHPDVHCVAHGRIWLRGPTQNLASLSTTARGARHSLRHLHPEWPGRLAHAKHDCQHILFRRHRLMHPREDIPDVSLRVVCVQLDRPRVPAAPPARQGHDEAPHVRRSPHGRDGLLAVPQERGVGT